MKLADAVAAAERTRPGALGATERIAVISALDAAVCAEIFGNREGNPAVGFTGYDSSSPSDTPLLVPAAFESIYVLRLDAEADYRSGDTGRYNNSAALFNDIWQRLEVWWKSGHRPLFRGGWRV